MDSAYAADIAKFKGLGLNFNAKLIGVQEVPAARGENICQEVINRLKQQALNSGAHKQKIVINISLDGMRMYDMKSNVRQLFKVVIWTVKGLVFEGICLLNVARQAYTDCRF